MSTDAGTVNGLYRVRVRLPDEPGALARLTAALAAVDCNILALSVHGQDAHSVVDELLVSGPCSVGELSVAICDAVTGGGVMVLPADPHDLVDPPTRALDLVAAGRTAADGVAALLGAASVRTPGPDDPGARDEHDIELCAADGTRIVARRAAPFTVTEVARAEAFLRAVATRPESDPRGRPTA
ncbi:ACT domain-containing protein [Pseudonocardia sp. ICBG1142]|uniref:ACT domain-containing protein n=1 Tax=Pseudonocardia sp. ICBG1142 TaxID=2846760 RepID=UPI000686C5DF|nr:ACT domain-containing protein [Pseudonocardia sp. ICBG1142]